MSHSPDRTLKEIFSHPMSMNIRWKDVIRMFESLGGEVEVVHSGREKVRLNGCEHTFHIPHGKSINSRDEVVQIRHFLEEAGVSPKAG